MPASSSSKPVPSGAGAYPDIRGRAHKNASNNMNQDISCALPRHCPRMTAPDRRPGNPVPGCGPQPYLGQEPDPLLSCSVNTSQLWGSKPHSCGVAPGATASELSAKLSRSAHVCVMKLL